MEAVGIHKIHEGKFLSYYEIEYINLNGKTKVYEMVSKNHNLTLDTIGKSLQAIVLMAFNSDHSKILLSKEFRMGVNQYVINNVAGLIDEGETPLEAASRELMEETGLKLTKILRVTKPSFPCAPVTDDMSTLILCEAEGDILPSDSPNEEIYAKWYSKEEIRNMLEDENIRFAARTQAFCLSWIEN